MTTNTKPKEVTLTRVFDAPRDLVWKAWTDPKHMARWWGPHGFDNPLCEMDVRPGGKLRIDMRGPDGNTFPMTGNFVEIAPPERLVFMSRAFEDAHGNAELEARNTVTFTEHGGKTTLRVHAVVTKATDAMAGPLSGMEMGWSQSLDKLDDLLDRSVKLKVTSDTEIQYTRMFNAPRRLVWDVYTKPEHVPHWWGTRTSTTIVDTMDVRPGGKWRFVSKAPEGEYAFGGEYKEVHPQDRLAWTFEWEAMPGHISTETFIFEDLGERTRLIGKTVFANKEDRDGMLETDMEEGMGESYERMDELLLTFGRNVVSSRTFSAPAASVWKAWTDTAMVMRWWGPMGWTCPVATMDVHVGRRSLVCMRAPQDFGGFDMYNTWTYRTIEPNKLLEFTVHFTDKDGNAFDPVAMGMPAGIPNAVRHVITFKNLGPSKTELTVTEYGYTSDKAHDLSKSGLEQCLDKMAQALTK